MNECKARGRLCRRRSRFAAPPPGEQGVMGSSRGFASCAYSDSPRPVRRPPPVALKLGTKIHHFSGLIFDTRFSTPKSAKSAKMDPKQDPI